MDPLPPDTAIVSRPLPAMESFKLMFDKTDPFLLDHYFGTGTNTPRQINASNSVGNFLLRMEDDRNLKENFALVIEEDVSLDTTIEVRAQEQLSGFMEMERRVEMAFRVHRHRFPTPIWHCCKRSCFAVVATDPTKFALFAELLQIHEYADKCHGDIEETGIYVEQRRRGIGTSTVAFAAPNRREREALSGISGTRRELALRKFAKFVVEVLPFLYGKANSPSGTKPPEPKLCTNAICNLLGISRNYLYHRKSIQNPESASEEYLCSLIDTAGARLRQHRPNGNRSRYPPLQNLQHYYCGCDVPCFIEVPQWTLVTEYNDFIKLAKQLRPRHKETCFLLDRLFCPLSNTSLKVFNRALSALYTVSVARIANVRRAIDEMCADSTANERPLLSDGSTIYQYQRTHPANRYPKEIRDEIENHLDMVLRADPAGSRGESVCRVYSPEINTQRKLRKVLRASLETDDSIESGISESTLQRMVKDYLTKRNYSAICFTQSDHNACPNCKTLQYAVLQYHHEGVCLQRKQKELFLQQRPFLQAEQSRIELLSDEINSKAFQERECVEELKRHNERDARIRGFLKKLSDLFRKIENKYRERAKRREESLHGEEESVAWCMFPDRGCITHQDDMSKIDLPHFVVSASSDITRWRFGVNAHVSAVTNNGSILSYEQGNGQKNASAIIEEIIVNHLLQCRGENIKVIVSDHAAVGKNWLTTIALPQYMVDQGLAEIVLIVFLENNHGKWLCDMLFGQFQSRRRRQIILGIDDMLAAFEDVRRRNGKVKGFAVNPLASVDFAAVFASLGYETKPSPEFGFTKRNINFSGACAAGAKERLPIELKELLGDALPDNVGIVRISCEPPGIRSQKQRRYEERWFDVPAAHLAEQLNEDVVGFNADLMLEVPLVVPMNHPYSSSGSGVVSTRTAEHVDFNGLSFRPLRACPELKDTSKDYIRQAWPRGLAELQDGELNLSCDEPVAGSESLKCAPLNWIVRRPVRSFCSSDRDWKARYPPRNLLNAKFRKGPRDRYLWVPTETYFEPPFPIREGTAACRAMKTLALQFSDISESLNLLDALKAVFHGMGDRDSVSDKWLQRKVTQPSNEAISHYRRELAVYREREKGYPVAPKTMRQVFKSDPKVREQAARIVSSRSLSVAEQRKEMTKTVSEIFDNAVKTPGALDRYYCEVEKDKDRFATELREFRKHQELFDTENELLPLPE